MVVEGADAAAAEGPRVVGSTGAHEKWRVRLREVGGNPHAYASERITEVKWV